MKGNCFIWYLLLFSVLACGKKNNTEKSEFAENYESTLPNYGNVNLRQIFSNSDNNLSNRNAIINIIDSFYDKIWVGGDLSGGVLVAKGDNILFEKYRGYAREESGQPITKNTAMHVASVSKPLTAMAVLKLVEAGKLELGTNVADIFEGFPYPEVTVEMLLQHRSGLPKYELFLEKAKVPTNNYISNQFILDFMIKNKPELARAPDTGFMYSNTNFALLALIVEKLTLLPFPEAMQEMIFKPLKMKDTYIFQEKDIATASQSFYKKGREIFPLDYLDLIYGDKNVYTTPRDLYNFSKAMYSKKFLKPELMQLVFRPFSNEKPGVNNYGLGFRMKIFDNGKKLTYHNGWWHGSNAVFAHLLQSKVSIIAIGNVFSGKVYSTLALSGLFEDFPLEKAKLEAILDVDAGQEDMVHSSD